MAIDNPVKQPRVKLKDAQAATTGGATYYGTGHRKTAVARVWLIEGGTGQVFVNYRPLDDYCGVQAWRGEIAEPLAKVKLAGDFDIWATASGGGVHSQMQAIRHGVAKALTEMDGELRVPLRRSGLLTRDPRVKERKKFGRKRARRGFQFSKR